MSESQSSPGSPLRTQSITTFLNRLRPSRERGSNTLKLDAERGGSGFPTTTEPAGSLNNDEPLFRTALELIDKRHDILIAVMGAHGVGKSTFIDAIKKESSKCTDNAPQTQRTETHDGERRGIGPAANPNRDAQKKEKTSSEAEPSRAGDVPSNGDRKLKHQVVDIEPQKGGSVAGGPDGTNVGQHKGKLREKEPVEDIPNTLSRSVSGNEPGVGMNKDMKGTMGSRAAEQAKGGLVPQAPKPPPKGINPTSFPIPGTKSSLVLIDTPNLDDPEVSNVKILETLHTWIKEEYSSSPEKTLSGVVYLHRITDVRFDIGAATTISLARDLIGGDVFDKICLTTTFWDEVPANLRGRYDNKEEELKNNQWKVFRSKKPGSTTSRFDTRIPGSARKTLIKLLDHANKKVINTLTSRQIIDKRKKSQPLNPDEVFYCQRQQLRTSVLYDDEGEQFPVPQSP